MLFRSQSQNLNLARLEEPQTLPAATVELVAVVPFSPANTFYKKEQIDKTITSSGEVIDLTILNFDLRKNHWIPVKESNLDSIKNKALATFGYHMESFFNQIKDVSNSFILVFSLEAWRHLVLSGPGHQLVWDLSWQPASPSSGLSPQCWDTSIQSVSIWRGRKIGRAHV